MPAVTVSSRGTNVVLSDDEAEREALTALRECGREMHRYDASEGQDKAALRLATNLYLYAAMLLDQVADRAP